MFYTTQGTSSQDLDSTINLSSSASERDEVNIIEDLDTSDQDELSSQDDCNESMNNQIIEVSSHQNSNIQDSNEEQSFIAARNKLFTEIVPITDDNSASAAIIALESGKAIIDVAEISRLEAAYMYAYIYRECAKLALTAVPTTGRKEKWKTILNYMLLEWKVQIITPEKTTHLNNAGKVECESFIAEVFSVRAAERMTRWLRLINDGKIPDILLQGTNFYHEDDSCDGIEPLDNI
ncbi:hypothetical protein F8M41_012744 [Gigaspora margarita]|uniref:Uncharacterized protein n=1 Tax=Gigaspora margarita TaxID=4874 RepID=A0A8H3X0K7_GIGMA|nr:hypothetical protein F8M41_012744 [Gigaspora margarita]